MNHKTLKKKKKEIIGRKRKKTLTKYHNFEALTNLYVDKLHQTYELRK